MSELYRLIRPIHNDVRNDVYEICHTKDFKYYIVENGSIISMGHKTIKSTKAKFSREIGCNGNNWINLEGLTKENDYE